MHTINVKTNARFDIVDITSEVQKCVNEKKIQSGIAVIFVPHTTAAVGINENADPDVVFDMKNAFNKLVPQHDNYEHGEGNSQAHVLSSLVAPSLTVIIENSKIVLGTWQDIYFFEFDGPRNRKVHIQVIGK
ncbi:secondary thiamine-phosphate synthase enzyme YjbQ [uncultured Brachyspira sp.]|uniref:secondary thiamine-phosphate synthase enzyme YjbQ n=1 Tax=uncultured Brachyspira sp. TaxID=221953 RepID=UPI00261EC317|nr:secondary thiamine-phosphate synthase enzyme YjbQ [uncultured Brachyspira sp.]